MTTQDSLKQIPSAGRDWTQVRDEIAAENALAVSGGAGPGESTTDYTDHTEKKREEAPAK